jgi:YebC/PmpR family DNA-binding regulatory protein
MARAARLKSPGCARRSLRASAPCCQRAAGRRHLTPTHSTDKVNKDIRMGAQWKAKHKDLASNAKGRLFGKLAKDIMIAARHGADPAANSRLRLVVEQARKVSMPKETLERAIKKGAGLTGETVHFEHAIYEGFAPHQVPVMVECLTDNVNRAASDMRVLFRKGQLGSSGSVSWDFAHLGMIEAEPASPGADPELAAIEAGAQDFEPADEAGMTLFLTEPGDLDLVSRALPAQGFTVLAAKLGYKPKNPVDATSLSAEQLEEVESFLAALDANEDVQHVYAGLQG